jgi:hypothetical protein
MMLFGAEMLIECQSILGKETTMGKVTYHGHLTAFARIFVVSETLGHDTIKSEATP